MESSLWSQGPQHETKTSNVTNTNSAPDTEKSPWRTLSVPRAGGAQGDGGETADVALELGEDSKYPRRGKATEKEVNLTTKDGLKSSV